MYMQSGWIETEGMIGNHYYTFTVTAGSIFIWMQTFLVVSAVNYHILKFVFMLFM